MRVKVITGTHLHVENIFNEWIKEKFQLINIEQLKVTEGNGQYTITIFFRPR